MKRYLIPFISALILLPASASESPTNGDRPSPATLTPSEKTMILAGAAKMLNGSIAYRGDGTASSTYHHNGQRILLEWRGLVVRRLIHGSVAIEERESGVIRRFYAQLFAPAYRSSTNGGKSWSAWKSEPCPFFPSHILIEETDDRFMVSAPTLAHFSPTPDPGFSSSERELMPHERVLARR